MRPRRPPGAQGSRPPTRPRRAATAWPRGRGSENRGSGDASRTSATSYSRPVGDRRSAAARRKARMHSRASATSTAPGRGRGGTDSGSPSTPGSYSVWCRAGSRLQPGPGRPRPPRRTSSRSDSVSQPASRVSPGAARSASSSSSNCAMRSRAVLMYVARSLHWLASARTAPRRGGGTSARPGAPGRRGSRARAARRRPCAARCRTTRGRRRRRRRRAARRRRRRRGRARRIAQVREVLARGRGPSRASSRGSSTGEHDQPRLAGAGGAQQVEARGVAVEDLDAEPAQQVDVVGVEVEHGRADAVRAAGSGRPIVPKRAEAGEDHRIVLVDPRRPRARGRAGVATRGSTTRSCSEQQERRQRHRERDRRDQQVRRSSAPSDAVLRREREAARTRTRRTCGEREARTAGSGRGPGGSARPRPSSTTNLPPARGTSGRRSAAAARRPGRSRSTRRPR